MMGKLRCRWVRARLPLLAGRELVGAERRNVERHLIGCPDCRRRRAELADTLAVLHAAGSASSGEFAGPPLWPDLARQIRESRRPIPGPDLTLGSFAGFRSGAGSALLGLCAGLGLLVAIGLGVAGARAARPVVRQARPHHVAAAHRPKPTKVAASAPAPKISAPGRDLPARTVETPVVESSPPPRSFDYDLEHGTPMSFDGPRGDGRDARPTPTY